MLAPSKAEISIIYFVLYKIAHFCFLTGSVVGKTIWDWTAATFTSLWLLNYSASDPIL